MSDQEHSPHTHEQRDAGGGNNGANHGGVGKYVAVFVALCLLTGASFFTSSSYWPFDKHAAWAFTIAVASTKAMLVVMFFMHLLWEANWKWVLTVPAACLAIVLVLMLVPDIAWRQDTGYAKYSEERLLYAADEPAASADNAPAEGRHPRKGRSSDSP